MNRNNNVIMAKLSQNITADLLNFVKANGQLPDRRLVTVLDAYLRWNGIIGYTAQILHIVEVTQPDKVV